MQNKFVVWLASPREVLMNKEFDRVWDGSTRKYRRKYKYILLLFCETH